MKKTVLTICCLSIIGLIVVACTKSTNNQPVVLVKDTGLVNTAHLDYLYTPMVFPNGVPAAAVYIYADAPDYHLVADGDEGFTCVDDVSRATLVYLRSNKFETDTATQSKVYHLVKFILEMQSANGYFYNFVFPSGLINKGGATSIDNANWWSWRALQTLSEASPLLKTKNATLANLVDAAINKLVARIKLELVNLPQTTKVVNGITVPEWLPAGSGTDQTAVLILGLVPYCAATNDAVIKTYIKKLADGIALMQQGDATHYPYSSILSWENEWHAYASDQAYALFQAGVFLGESQYTTKAMAEVDNFYPWLIQNGSKASFTISNNGSQFVILTDKPFDQIAYGIRPMVFAAIEAYKITGQEKYADMAGHLAAWFLGANVAGTNMYDMTTGRCFDGISSASSINRNSGAESTIEALLAMQRVEKYFAVKTAMNKYKK